MKKSIAAGWVIATSIVLLSLCLLSDANAQVLSRNLSLRDLSEQLKTPEAVAHFMWSHFSFEKDRRQFGNEENWQRPDQFLTTKKGDCEDFALFAYEILKQNGIRAFVFNVYGEGYGHSVCVFLENGRYQILDGTDVFRINAENLDEVASEIYPFWKNASVITPVGNYSGFKAVKKISRS